jgi:hypothetical protein
MPEAARRPIQQNGHTGPAQLFPNKKEKKPGNAGLFSLWA